MTEEIQKAIERARSANQAMGTIGQSVGLDKTPLGLQTAALITIAESLHVLILMAQDADGK